MKRRWVGRLPDGKYIKSRSSWSSAPVADLQRARVYHVRDVTQKNIEWIEVEIKEKA